MRAASLYDWPSPNLREACHAGYRTYNNTKTARAQTYFAEHGVHRARRVVI